MPLPILPPILSSLAPVALFVPPWLLILFISTGLFYFWVTNWPGTKIKVKPMRASAFDPGKSMFVYCFIICICDVQMKSL